MMATVLVLSLHAFGATEARAQFAEPCDVGCALTLGLSSGIFATGVTAAVGRLEGGYTTKAGVIVTWSAGFAVATGAGIALQGDGGRQRRAIYGSAIGAAGGALTGLALESLVGESTEATRWAATLIGSAVGVLAGGIVGAAGYDGPEAAGPTFTLVGPTLSLPVGF